MERANKRKTHKQNKHEAAAAATMNDDDDDDDDDDDNNNNNNNGKGHPITGHEDQEGGQMYSSTLPSTSELDGGGWSTPRPCRFTPEKDPVPIV